MTFTPDTLLDELRRLPAAQRYWIAYSGGMDSHTLLHAMAALRQQLPDSIVLAVHVDHGLQAASRQWSQHCEQVCAQLGVPCHTLCVDARAPAGESPEAYARQARYAAIEALLHNGDMVLTAHHQDDQAETLLLQMLRGAGPKGMAAMPLHQSLGPGTLGRPLLAFSRRQLQHYADAQQLHWVDDPSNSDTGFDRNYVRHELMPRLAQRWPAVVSVLARSAGHHAEAGMLLDDLAMMDMERCRSDDVRTLNITALLALTVARRKNLLRYWLHSHGFVLPTTRILEQVLQMLQARQDSAPRITWAGCELRRYRDQLHVMAPLSDLGAVRSWCWDMRTPLLLPGVGTLRVTRETGQGIAAAAINGHSINVALRQGGERIQPVGQPHHHSLKNLFQQSGVPPWQRDRVPLLYCDGRLIAVVGFWLAEGVQVGVNDEGYLLRLS